MTVSTKTNILLW